MSYCRFSGDDWKSDIYCYQGGEGWVINVACKRHVGEIPPLPRFDAVSPEEYVRAMAAQADALEKCQLVPIGLPCDGQDYLEPSRQDCLDRLLELRGMGYHVPEYALEEIRAEMAEMETTDD